MRHRVILESPSDFLQESETYVRIKSGSPVAQLSRVGIRSDLPYQLSRFDRLVRRSAGSISARSAPSTPLQATPDVSQGQQSVSGSQLTVASYPQPPRSPSHTALRCNDR